jgi:hypothetical protein
MTPDPVTRPFPTVVGLPPVALNQTELDTGLGLPHSHKLDTFESPEEVACSGQQDPLQEAGPPDPASSIDPVSVDVDDISRCISATAIDISVDTPADARDGLNMSVAQQKPAVEIGIHEEADTPHNGLRDWTPHGPPNTEGLDAKPINTPTDPSEVFSEDEHTAVPLLKRPRSPMLVETAQDGSKRARTYVQCFAPTKDGTTVIPVYLVNQSRKRTVVVDVHEGLLMPEMRAAMDREVASFRAMECIETVPMQDVGRGSNLVTTRWVFTIKTKEDWTKRYKARLVARGFEDDERDRVTRDSPTAANSSQRLVLQVLAERQWIPTSWDFETAFLQGKPI